MSSASGGSSVIAEIRKLRKEIFVDFLVAIGVALVAIAATFATDFLESARRAVISVAYGGLGLALILVSLVVHKRKNENCSEEPGEEPPTDERRDEKTEPSPRDWGEAQVLATMIYGQDNTAWLAFSLAMTTEVLLLIGFFQITLEEFRWVLALAGVLVGLIFRNMVIRSNGDLAILYSKTKRKHFEETFDLPSHCRKGVSAGLTMNVALGGWIIAWLIALGAILIGVIE